MKIIYAHEPLVDLKNTIFLAGPTPRNAETKSWRPDFIQELNNVHFDGTVLVPEASDGIWKNDYIGQVKWELEAINKADIIAFWIPRSIPDMPGFTTNVEFGMCVTDVNKFILYGRPNDAEKNSYLDFLYTEYVCETPYNTITDMVDRILYQLNYDTYLSRYHLNGVYEIEHMGR